MSEVEVKILAYGNDSEVQALYKDSWRIKHAVYDPTMFAVLYTRRSDHANT